MTTPDIYQALRESHEIQRAWCTRLTRTRATKPQGRRDAKLYEIGAGTSEIRRMLIGRELFAETM